MRGHRRPSASRRLQSDEQWERRFQERRRSSFTSAPGAELPFIVARAKVVSGSNSVELKDAACVRSSSQSRPTADGPLEPRNTAGYGSQVTLVAPPSVTGYARSRRTDRPYFVDLSASHCRPVR